MTSTSTPPSPCIFARALPRDCFFALMLGLWVVYELEPLESLLPGTQLDG